MSDSTKEREAGSRAGPADFDTETAPDSPGLDKSLRGSHFSLYAGLLARAPLSDKNNVSILRTMVRSLKRHKYAWIFLEPVDPVELDIPDYFDIISKPMDLSTLESNLEKGKYKHVAEFADDCNLIWSNAILYNPPDTDAALMAQAMASNFNSKMLNVIPKLTTSVAGGVKSGAQGSVTGQNGQGGEEDDDFCSICKGGDSVAGNLIVLCDGKDCKGAAHQVCGRLHEVPKGNWYCFDCRQNLSKHRNEKVCCGCGCGETNGMPILTSCDNCKLPAHAKCVRAHTPGSMTIMEIKKKKGLRIVCHSCAIKIDGVTPHPDHEAGAAPSIVSPTGNHDTQASLLSTGGSSLHSVSAVVGAKSTVGKKYAANKFKTGSSDSQVKGTMKRKRVADTPADGSTEQSRKVDDQNNIPDANASRWGALVHECREIAKVLIDQKALQRFVYAPKADGSIKRSWLNQDALDKLQEEALADLGQRGREYRDGVLKLVKAGSEVMPMSALPSGLSTRGPIATSERPTNSTMAQPAGNLSGAVATSGPTSSSTPIQMHAVPSTMGAFFNSMPSRQTAAMGAGPAPPVMSGGGSAVRQEGIFTSIAGSSTPAFPSPFGLPPTASLPMRTSMYSVSSGQQRTAAFPVYGMSSFSQR